MTALRGILLLAAIAAVYWPVEHYPFVNYDDNLYVYENPHVLGGLTWENVRWAFDGFHANFWHPLVWVSLMLDRSLFGPGAGGFHVMNVAIHTVNAFLLWAALRMLTRASGRSFAVALLWAVHPLRVESVAGSPNEKTRSAGSSGSWPCLLTRHTRRRPAAGDTRLLAGAFALGLMAKPILVTLPLILLILDVWPLRRWRNAGDAWPLIIEKLPLLALSGIAAGAAFIAQDSGGAVYPLPLGLRAATALRAAAGYVRETI